ncbi:MAG TPA: diaminopimelate epimerase [Candidatus Binataceae bacterium]|jgi:diaminopimelate epimerase
MSILEFTKMQGCGNDYIFTLATDRRPGDPAALAKRLSDRRFGIGGDGLILLCSSEIADLKMEMYNADGSRGAMCGNGIRCLARLAYESGVARKNPIAVETDSGIRTVWLKFDGSRICGATVDMGAPILEGRDIPTLAGGRVIQYPLEVAGKVETITAVSMGNPHCVIFVGDDSIFKKSDSEFAALGREFERHPFFPDGVNTEFVLPIAKDRLRMRVWERGSGETFACGTGACAALVAAVLTARAERKATVELRGGNLEIEWRDRGADSDHVFMTGDAVEVFRTRLEVGSSKILAL